MTKPIKRAQRVADSFSKSSATQVVATTTTKRTGESENPFRALLHFTKLPPAHKTFLVGDDASAPHLKPHEFAVIDTRHTEPRHGDLFVIQWDSSPRRAIVQTRRSVETIEVIKGAGFKENEVWWVRDLAGFRSTGETVDGGIPVYAGLSDGPYLKAHLESKILGAVVGYASTALGDLMPSEQSDAERIVVRFPAKAEKEVLSMYELYPLPFLDAQQRCCWSVQGSGSYAKDCEIGRGYADAYLSSCDGTVGWSTLLGCIVRDMAEKRDRSGLVIGFMGRISRALQGTLI